MRAEETDRGSAATQTQLLTMLLRALRTPTSTGSGGSQRCPGARWHTSKLRSNHRGRSKAEQRCPDVSLHCLSDGILQLQEVAAGKANDLAIGGGPTQKPLERRRPKAWPPARKVRHGGGDRGSDAILPGNQLIMQCSPASLAKNLGQRTQDVRVLGHFCPACLSARQSKQVLPGIIACTLT